VDADPAALRVHVTLLELETALRGGAVSPDRVEGLVSAVMSRISPTPGTARPALPRSPGSRMRRLLPLGLALGATAAFALVGLSRVGPRRGRHATPPGAPASAPVETARVPSIAAPSAALDTDARAHRPAPEPGDGAVTVLSFDFEDGQLPPELLAGDVGSYSCAGGSRFCALGGISLLNPREQEVQLDRPTLMHHRRTLVVAFDYHVGADTPELTVQIRDRDKGQNYRLYLHDLRRGAWASAEARLADFVGNVRQDEPMDEGDRLGSLIIMGGAAGGGPLYVDNVRVLDYPPGRLPPRSSGGGPPRNSR
jgi:hypothetical protein